MSEERFEQTMEFNNGKEECDIPSIIFRVYDALEEKDYHAVNQIIGYLISGDPSYITSFKDARNLIQKIEREDLMETFIRFYLENAKR